MVKVEGVLLPGGAGRRRAKELCAADCAREARISRGGSSCQLLGREESYCRTCARIATAYRVKITFDSRLKVTFDGSRWGTVLCNWWWCGVRRPEQLEGPEHSLGKSRVKVTFDGSRWGTVLCKWWWCGVRRPVQLEGPEHSLGKYRTVQGQRGDGVSGARTAVECVRVLSNCCVNCKLAEKTWWTRSSKVCRSRTG